MIGKSTYFAVCWPSITEKYWQILEYTLHTHTHTFATKLSLEFILKIYTCTNAQLLILRISLIAQQPKSIQIVHTVHTMDQNEQVSQAVKRITRTSNIWCTSKVIKMNSQKSKVLLQYADFHLLLWVLEIEAEIW